MPKNIFIFRAFLFAQCGILIYLYFVTETNQPTKMKTTTKALVNLVPGQIVAVMNCREYGIIIERTGKNLYSVSHPIGNGKPVVIRRQALSTYVRGAWRPNSDASSLAPHAPISTK